jgi:FkbM family methyltransferase
MKLIKSAVKSILRKKNLKIVPIKEYDEKLPLVKYDWMKKLDVHTVIDAGASTGGFASKIREIFPAAHIYSFEPLEDPFRKLQENFAADAFFEAHRLVLGAEKGTVTFYENEYSGSSSMLKMEKAHIDAYPFTEKVREIKAAVDTLGSFA